MLVEDSIRPIESVRSKQENPIKTFIVRPVTAIF